jgi:hypothetical protein
MGKHLDVVKKWYKDFDNGHLNDVVSVFTDDAIVTIGAGDSAGAVPYGGRFVGIKQIRNYYDWRISKRAHVAGGLLRPFCGFVHGGGGPGFEQEFGPWVIAGSTIHDTGGDKSSIYQGAFLHVWSFDANGMVTSMTMYFDMRAIM